MRQNLIAEAIDHFEDAARFLKEARREADKRNECGLAQFLALASESASNGEFAIQRMATNSTDSEGAKG